MPAGTYPPPTDPLFRALPGWQPGLQRLLDGLPPLGEARVAGVEAVTSLERLGQQVQQAPALWCDGTGEYVTSGPRRRFLALGGGGGEGGAISQVPPLSAWGPGVVGKGGWP